jgi:hypothetical protein
MAQEKFRIQDLFVDILVTIAVISAVLLEIEWLTYLVIGYTFFLLFIKLMVLVSEQLRAITAKNKSTVPDLYYHLLYGINVIILGLSGWFITALAWMGIWVLSVFSSKKQ